MDPAVYFHHTDAKEIRVSARQNWNVVRHVAVLAGTVPLEGCSYQRIHLIPAGQSTGRNCLFHALNI